MLLTVPLSAGSTASPNRVLAEGDGVSPRQVILHIVIDKVFSGPYRLGLGSGLYVTHFRMRLKEVVMVKLTGRGEFEPRTPLHTFPRYSFEAVFESLLPSCWSHFGSW